jgi:hypothetical protein
VAGSGGPAGDDRKQHAADQRVELGGEEIVVRHAQLSADQEAEHAGEQHEGEGGGGGGVPQADLAVVDR